MPKLCLSLKEWTTSHSLAFIKNTVSDCIYKCLHTLSHADVLPAAVACISARFSCCETVSCRRANQLYLLLSGPKTQIRREERRMPRSVLFAVSIACRYCSTGDKRGIGTKMIAELYWKRRTSLAPPVNPTRHTFYKYLTRQHKLNFRLFQNQSLFFAANPFLSQHNWLRIQKALTVLCGSLRRVHMCSSHYAWVSKHLCELARTDLVGCDH